MRFRVPTAAALAATLSALILSDAPSALAGAQMTPNPVLSDQTIREWLATHPEVTDKIVLDALARADAGPVIDKMVRDSYLRQPALAQEGAAALQAKQQADRAALLQKALPAAHNALYNDARDGRQGAAKPAAAVVILYDYECPYCRSVEPDLARLVKEHSDVAVIYKEFPILGQVSLFAAKASLAAVEQGQSKFAALHAALMASKIPEHQLKEEQVLDMAKAAGLDIDRLKTDMAAPEINDKIAADKSLADNLGIQGTPGIIIGNHLVPGNVPYERLVQLVDEAKTAGKQTALLK